MKIHTDKFSLRKRSYASKTLMFFDSPLVLPSTEEIIFNGYLESIVDDDIPIENLRSEISKSLKDIVFEGLVITKFHFTTRKIGDKLHVRIFPDEFQVYYPTR